MPRSKLTAAILPGLLCLLVVPSIGLTQWPCDILKSAPRELAKPMREGIGLEYTIDSSTRRSVFLSILSAPFFMSEIAEAEAVESEQLAPRMQRPRAPTELLVPAVKVRQNIDKCIKISRSASKENLAQSIADLDRLLLEPQNYTSAVLAAPQRPASQYLESYDQKRKSLSLLEKPGAMLVQNGEIDTWKRLKRQEKAKEGENEIRAALNLYTSNLNFRSDSYVFTGSNELRSQLIRSDALPDVKAVIVSDLELRELHRNSVLTSMDDARAELQFQMSRDGPEKDLAELADVLLQAKSSLDQWFSLVDEEDIKEANKLLAESASG